VPEGASKENGPRVFSMVCSEQTMGSGYKLKDKKFNLNIRIFFFTVRGMKQRNRLSRELAEFSSLCIKL